jgi:hypothetical protein
VWNYPVTAYYITDLEEIDEAKAKELTGISKLPNYAWNPEAKEFTRVTAELQLSTGRMARYDYVLEKVDGFVIGGEWIGLSANDHPDFAWIQETPEPVNPFLDVRVIDEIAALSRQPMP